MPSTNGEPKRRAASYRCRQFFKSLDPNLVLIYIFFKLIKDTIVPMTSWKECRCQKDNRKDIVRGQVIVTTTMEKVFKKQNKTLFHDSHFKRSSWHLATCLMRVCIVKAPVSIIIESKL